MAEDLYALTNDDLRVLKGFVEQLKRQRVDLSAGGGNRFWLDHEEHPAPETYIARSPATGISGLFHETGTGIIDTPGSASCQVYRMSGTTLTPVTGLTKTVYNFTDACIPPNTWLTITREKYGVWTAGEHTSRRWVLLLSRHRGAACQPGTGTDAAWEYAGVFGRWALDSTGCFEFQADFTEGVGTFYEANDREVSTPVVVEAHQIYYDNQQTGTGSIDDACRWVFSGESESQSGPCLKESTISFTQRRCNGRNVVVDTYHITFGPDANECWGLNDPELVTSTITSECCLSCGDTTGTGTVYGSGCATCQRYYCVAFTLTSSPPASSDCAGLDGLKITLDNGGTDQCNRPGYPSGTWWTGISSYNSPPSSGTYLHGQLIRYCDDRGGVGAATYAWYLNVNKTTPTYACSNQLITDSPTLLFEYLGESTDPDMPPATSGSISASNTESGCKDCNTGVLYTGTWTLSMGQCQPDDAGTGSITDDPCGSEACHWQCRNQGVPPLELWVLVKISDSCGGTCTTPSTINTNCVAGLTPWEFFCCDCSGLTCTNPDPQPGSDDNPTCADCPKVNKTATLSGASGAFASCTTSAALLYNSTTDTWSTRGLGCCDAIATPAFHMACIDDEWFGTFDGMTSAVAANAGGTCNSLVFVFTNVNFACGTGSVTVEVTT